MDHARKGEAALSAGNLDEAIQHFTKALSANNQAVKYYISRSTAYHRAARRAEALADAELAVVLAYKRGSRELIRDAQYRRAVSLYHIERYADANFVFDIVRELDPKNKMLPVWDVKVGDRLREIPDGDEKLQVKASKVPDVEIPSVASPPKEPAKAGEEVPAILDAPAKPPAASAASTPSVNPPKAAGPPSANKIKIDWYQNNETVTINVLAKGVSKDALTVDIEKDTLSIGFPTSGDTAQWQTNYDPLYALIDPTQSKYRVMSTKIEIVLKKAQAGVKWKDLEGVPEEGNNTGKGESSSASNVSAPVYPTSSKSGAKNWDKLAADDLKEEDLIEGDESSHFFKNLYKDATPEQQRAMMKSYSESGGTVLSTDWSNVGSREVVPEPPDGMEAKKY
ncbi:SGS-domain-containing protein [Pyrenochaeta sp. DS3sAY3a]|nr:SGS-domain-containing protein [Pyrenochaeta sp. DS3sAY3a]